MYGRHAGERERERTGVIGGFSLRFDVGSSTFMLARLRESYFRNAIGKVLSGKALYAEIVVRIKSISKFKYTSSVLSCVVVCGDYQ